MLIILLITNIENTTLIEIFGKKGHDDKILDDDDKSFRSIDKVVSISEHNTITLAADKIQSTYLWKNNGKYNPILNFNNNDYYKIITTSLPDDNQEHELIIETLKGNKLTESDEIEHGSSAELIFKYDGNNSQLKYYCEYHTQSMIGIINIINNKK
jgi:hypothetical protein